MPHIDPPRCIIIAPLYDGGLSRVVTRQPGDMVICADGGYRAAVAAGISPDLVVGDFDSMPDMADFPCPVVRLPREKDDTDMVVCIREGRSRGFTRFDIVGASGGRADHAMANLQCLADCALRGESARLLDGQNEMTVCAPGRYTFRRKEGYYFSLLAYSPEVTGVCLSGTAWPLRHETLTYRFPLGVSNVITQEHAVLSFDSGLLLAVYARDQQRAGRQ